MDDEITKVYEKKPVELSLDKEITVAEVVISHPVYKPKKIFIEVKERVLATLASGASKKKVCESFGISLSTVNRILRLNPDVAKNIYDTANVKMSFQKREEWTTAAFNNRKLGVKGIRKLIPDVYAWLYRNDITWLKIQNANLPSGRRGNNSTINWDDRDEELCARVTNTFSEHNTTSMTPRKCDIYELVPGLYSALESKSHYAKTRKLLAELTKSGPDNDC
jgi:hypothetical protein